MSLFPKARPTKAAKQAPKPKRWPVHRCIPSGVQDWSGQEICTCGMVESHRTHQVDEELAAQAAQMDSRKLGEGVEGG